MWGKARFSHLVVTACAVAMLQAGPAAAAEPLSGGVYSSSTGDAGTLVRNIDMSMGRSIIVDLPRDAKEVFVANPKVANAVVRSTRKLFLIGIANGATSIFAMDAEGRQIAALQVTVGRDLSVLRQTLRTTLPNARIEVKPAGDSVLLTGNVTSAIDAQQAVDIATAFVGETSGMTKGGVINGLQISGKDQVMLRVTVVEVSRTVIKQFGISTSGNWSAVDIATTASFPVNTQSLAAANAITGSIRNGNVNLGATLQAFERAGVSRVLAEPTLVAVSGESATFTAGGEIPVPSSQNCSTVVGVTSCQIGVTYKPFGVNLAFTPMVLSENRIALRVNTEVTEIDPRNQISFTTVVVPGFRVRKTTTSVELPSGATMMTAGLISTQNGQAISGLPGLLNLPVLGALFRSRDYQRSETELVIMVTPYIAKPMESAQAKRPDDGFVEANDGQTVLMGRLNKIYGVVGSKPAPQQYRGNIGFITD